MTSVYNFSQTEIMAFALVLLRMTGFVFTIPIFSSENVPVSLRVLFSLILAFVAFPMVQWKGLTYINHNELFILGAIKEVFIGLTFGFMARMFVSVFTMMGQLASVSIGLSAGQLFDPNIGEMSSALDQFYFILSSLLFLSMDGHHMLIRGILGTFEFLPLNNYFVVLSGMSSMAAVIQEVTIICVRLAGPIIATILFMNVAVSIIGRAVPQINILVTSMPVNIMAGILVMTITLPLLLWQVNEVIGLSISRIFDVLKTM